MKPRLSDRGQTGTLGRHCATDRGRAPRRASVSFRPAAGFVPAALRGAGVGGKGRRDEEWPDAPGWYPDPWSATGTGERYFDGKRWGTSEKPLGRASAVDVMTSPRHRAWYRRGSVRTVVVLVLLAAAIWVTSRPKHSRSRTAGQQDSSAPTTALGFNRPPPSKEEGAHPLGTPAPAPAGNGGFEFIEHQEGSENVPVAFDPCRPIHYVINSAGAPPDGTSLVHDAMARVQTATGLQFIDDGTTTELPVKERDAFQPSRYGNQRWAPVLIAWSDEASYPSLAGFVAGETRNKLEYSNTNRLVYVSGQIVLDREQLSSAKAPDRAQAKAVILHELGHLVGLDHVADRTQIMFSESVFNVTDYAAGDLRGLAALGTQACYPDL